MKDAIEGIQIVWIATGAAMKDNQAAGCIRWKGMVKFYDGDNAGKLSDKNRV